MDIFGSLPAALRRDQRGAVLVEYLLLLALISIICIMAISALGTDASEKFGDLGSSIANAGG